MNRYFSDKCSMCFLRFIDTTKYIIKITNNRHKGEFSLVNNISTE